MKYEAAVVALAGLATARHAPHYGVTKREVPQEHSHNAILASVNTFLKMNNPLQIEDAVFSLLGNAAAAAGAPKVANLDCLQQIVSDQAFTNAKAANNVAGMANAVMFRALERNTGAVGLASVLCNETATNSEIAAITQHQDPASTAASGNKDIALAVAKQLASFGADPTLAIQTGTFAPGKIGDPTAAGNTCDVLDDEVGCIISQNLLVPDVTADEISAAVSGVPVSTTTAPSSTTGDTAAGCKAATPSATTASTGSNTGSTTSNAATGANVQTFTGSLGGLPPAVTDDTSSDRPFSVDGSTFLTIGAALQRSCSVQHNACADAANSGKLSGGESQCETQETQCNAAAAAQKARRWAGPGKKRVVERAVNTGSCGSPAIEFADGLDGRKEASFQAVNQVDFNHGSALNIGVIADFICNELASKCKADAATVQTCQSAADAAAQQTGQAAADTFNNALGV